MCPSRIGFGANEERVGESRRLVKKRFNYGHGLVSVTILHHACLLPATCCVLLEDSCGCAPSQVPQKSSARAARMPTKSPSAVSVLREWFPRVSAADLPELSFQAL